MQRLTTPEGTNISYASSGTGAPLVLVHGGFSDHETNWEFVKRLLEPHFTLYAIARRGRGETDGTDGHSVEDEARDVAALIRDIATPVHLLGHSYGGHCALAAALLVPELIDRLIVYEAAWPAAIPADGMAKLEALAAADAWDEFAFGFFRDLLKVPVDELQALRATTLWGPIVADARASLQDLRSLQKYEFDPQRWRNLRIPVLLQIGSDSPRELYVTDALASVLPNAEFEVFAGQAHEAMTTAPQRYADSVIRFLAPGSRTPFEFAAMRRA